MINITKNWKYLLVFCVGLLTVSPTEVAAASAAKQLAKGISLYDDGKDEKAMDYFIDVLVNGNAEEVAEANKYITQIHNRIGGIQTPVEVDVNFKEGEVRSIDDVAEESVQQAQLAAQQEAQRLQAAQEAAAAQAAAQQQQALDAVNAQQQALTERIEAQKLAAQDQAAQYKSALQNTQEDLAADWDMAQAKTAAGQEALAQQATTAGQNLEDATVAATVGAAGLTAAEAADWQAVADQTTAQLNAGRDNVLTTVNGESAFTDLTSEKAIEARELYTAQKIASMTEAAMKNINDTKGVHLYMRDNRPDALDMDPEVIFENNTFRSSALPLLNSVYELLALTQGSAYVILPPGSYTDDVTLSGIRQAMALNSYLINRGISQGKLHYNMGLVDEEPPARFANLHGLSIVFDYDAKLPTVMEKNEQDEKAPLLSMAIVPLCHAIDRSLGEAFAIDFSVLETVDPLDNWVLQVVQHGHDGNYYIVRQLEGFAPVYHQILFNGRKGIIGPELPCGKYTLVLTGTDLKGNKQTLRRRVIVKCADTKNTCDGSCAQTAKTETAQKELDYKAARLWVKPGRTMNTAPSVSTAAAATSTSSNTYTKTVNTTTIIEEDDGTDPLAGVAGQPAAAPTAPYAPATNAMPVNNPYDMPYEDYNN